MLLIFLAVFVLSLCALFFYFADGDLVLMWYEQFGHKAYILKGQVAWVTGASSGIGKQIAYQLARVGCKLVLSARNTTELENVKKDCLTCGHLTNDDILVLPFDITDTAYHSVATDTVLKTFGKIDILVNNAGRSQRAWITDAELAVDRQMIELNTVAPISLTKCVLPHMITRQRGHISVTSSLAAKITVPFSATYCLTKSAVNAWFHCLEMEMSPHNILVTVACPGPVFSNVTTAAFTGKSGLVYGEHQEEDKNRMSASRCAELMVTAIANGLSEVWIGHHPTVLVAYCLQYLPLITSRIFRIVGLKKIMAMREGR